ncbi:hypothetical protein JVU11DRAFT_4904 [Chiua virens]|nr:hypothetical protein JVU11DRAFT_4904 [Chiua virens]
MFWVGLVLAIPVTAIQSEFKRDFIGLFPSDSSSTFHPIDTSHISIKTLTRSSPSPSTIPTLSTAHASSELWTPSFQSDLILPTTTAKTSLAPTPSIPPASTQNQATTDHSSRTWQIIGIAIIAVLFIATTITCAVFFDRLWRLLKDVVCCISHPLIAEELMPDCEKQSWDTRPLSPSDREAPSPHTVRTRELPWDTEPQHRNTLHRQPSRRSDHSPPA